MGKKQELHLRVRGDRRDEMDTRRLARAIVRLAVELGTEQAQSLADALEHEEALRHKVLARQRRANRQDGEKESA